MKKLKYYVELLCCVPYSFYFCWKQLPFRQAIHLPILVNKIDCLSMRGGVILEDKISFGMIRLGFRRTAVYPNNGIVWKNEGKVVFRGKCEIGNSSYVICDERGKITFGDNFYATGGLRIVSKCGIEIGKNTLVGWGNTIIDTDFHPLYFIENEKYSRGYGCIKIGENNWLSSFCMVLHSVHTADNCVFSSCSMLTRNVNYEENSLYGGNPIKWLKQGVRLDVMKRSVDYNN